MTFTLYLGDALDAYPYWDTPDVIVSDGAYGISGFPGDPSKPEGLASWYEPHVVAWSNAATTKTTLWFWNTEIGWANTHPVLAAHGWKYVECCVWDKGAGHVAGRVNSKTMRTLPVTTELCVLYERQPEFDYATSSMRDWMRSEWARTGLPWRETNSACGVKDAATRKYFASDDCWYPPPPERFKLLVDYANKHGAPTNTPYFFNQNSLGIPSPVWERRTWNYPEGWRNVWNRPPLRGDERIKSRPGSGASMHSCQKPLDLMDMTIRASSNPGDVVWEPFGGLGGAAVAAINSGREAFVAEVNADYQPILRQRLHNASHAVV